jgi:hypothetical protein
MSQRPARFTESDIRRAAKAVLSLGRNAYIQVAPDGTITIGFIEPNASTEGRTPKKNRIVV